MQERGRPETRKTCPLTPRERLVDKVSAEMPHSESKKAAKAKRLDGSH